MVKMVLEIGKVFYLKRAEMFTLTKDGDEVEVELPYFTSVELTEINGNLTVFKIVSAESPLTINRALAEFLSKYDGYIIRANKAWAESFLFSM